MAHGLSGDFFDALHSGPLKWLVDRVKQDHTLDLEIRDDVVHLYYRGGRLMVVNHTGSKFPSSIDENYWRGRPAPCVIPRDATDAIHWKAAIPLLKQEMDFFLARKSGNEREFQQTLVRENNVGKLGNATDYFICSMEYQSPNGRFDAVAIHWPSDSLSRKRTTDLPLVLIEIKFGDDAISGKCGLNEHLDDFSTLVQDSEKLDSLSREMTVVFQQKQRLGLVTGLKKEITSISAEGYHVLFVLANTDPEATRLAVALDLASRKLPPCLREKLWISRASQFGSGLFHDLNLSVAAFQERQLTSAR